MIVIVAWVFFRAQDLPHAMFYLKDMAGMSSPSDAAILLSGLVLKSYYIVFILIASYFVWLAWDTWEFLQNLSRVRVMVIACIWIVALIALRTQNYNPFIYFIF